MIKIVLVDDEPFSRIGFKSLINWEENGFSIEGEASNGKEALEVIKKVNPDIIITDIKMPVMDGIDLIKEVCKLKRRPEIIVLSCFDDFPYVKDALKMGAADYLIKSDIKTQQLLDVLAGLKKKIEEHWASHREKIEMSNNLNKSINFLKETFFKELISGIIKNEDKIIEQMKHLNISLTPEKLIIIKIKLDDFKHIKNKYIEKDEMLLRFSVVNILKEIVPGKFNKEIVVENSQDYILIFNIHGENYHEIISKLCDKISSAIKDFLNISVSIGVSEIVSSFQNIRTAYNQAEEAVNMRFFYGKGKITFFDDLKKESRRDCSNSLLSKAMENSLRASIENFDKKGCISKIKELHDDLIRSNISEGAIRRIYIRIVELFGSSIPIQPQMENQDACTPYEEILTMETCDEISEYVSNYVDLCFKIIQDESFLDYKTNVERAVEIIKKHYYEDLSLQTVAEKINLNPSYLSRIFKQATGENFTSFLTKVRIEKAKLYLGSKKLKVYEVAEKVGYQNYTYFSRIFKKIVGVSPEEYK